MKGTENIGLIVAADEPALFFTSVKAAETYLEAVDVRDGVYTAAYGPDGQPHRIDTQGNRVVITPEDDKVPEPEALKALLLSYLSKTGDEAGERESLGDLLTRCARAVSA